MDMLFSQRMNTERQFEEWCKKTQATNCASNFLVYLLSTKTGHCIIIKLYSELLNGIITETDNLHGTDND